MSIGSRVLRTMVAVATVGGGIFLAAPAAHAAGNITCTKASGAATITPGLTTTPTDQTIASKGKGSGCSGSTGITSYKVKGTLTATGADCQGDGTIKGKLKTTWSNGKTSVAKVTGKSPSIGLVNFTGKITSGLFVGDLLTTQVSFTPVTGDCTPGNPVTAVTYKQTKNLVIK
jgi:hypothetical protein